MIEGRVLADGTPEVGPLPARPDVLRQLLVVSIALGSVGTFAGGLRSIDRIGPDALGFFATASSLVAVDADIALLAAEAGSAELAQVDDAVQVVVTEPVLAVIESGAPSGKLASVDVEKVANDASTSVSAIAASTTTTAAAPEATSTTVVAPTTTVPATTTTAPPETTTTLGGPTTTTTAIRTYTADEVKAIITEVFGEANAPSAIRVATCESGLNPRAISKGGGNWGLFQINKVHQQRVARMGYAWEDLLDPRVNSNVAKAIFDDSGWGPWACNP